MNNLIEAGHADIQDKLTGHKMFEWRVRRGTFGFFRSIQSQFSPENLIGSWANLDRVPALLSCYEFKEATIIFELALWKARIEEKGAVTVEERSECHGDVPWPADDVIMQYFG